jgi:hypothetical protein
MDNVHKPSDSECYTQLSEPFNVLLFIEVTVKKQKFYTDLDIYFRRENFSQEYLFKRSTSNTEKTEM